MENKFLSLDWFKQTAESAITKVVAEKLEQLMQEEETPKIRPCLRVQLSNDILTVVLNDGSVITKPDATEADFHAVSKARDAYEIHAIIGSRDVAADVEKAKAEAARIKALQEGIQLLADLDDFIVEGNSVYLKGTSRSMPQLLVEKFIEIVYRESYYTGFGDIQEALNNDDDYMAHKNFFMWCCLNPRAEVANELYRFLTDNSFKITKQGFFVALRNVVTLHGSPELVYFVSNAYNKVKAVWKKNPDDYTIFLEEGEYKLVHKDNLTKIEPHTTTTCPDCLGDGGWEDEDAWEDGE